MNITLPDSVKSIGSGAFNWCTSLTSINIPGSVTHIESDTFSNCASLTSINIPDSVTSIGNNAFLYCGLTEIVIPDSVTSIGPGAFHACVNLTSITIPDSVKSIAYDTFNTCTSLKSITIPDSVKSIGEGAFSDCPSLTHIVIPDSVEKIGMNALQIFGSNASIDKKEIYVSIYGYDARNPMTRKIVKSLPKMENFPWGLPSHIAKSLMGQLQPKTPVDKSKRVKPGVRLAPNGKPSNLNKWQYLMVRTKAFKAWFGDWENDPEHASKMLDENGEPEILWHGSAAWNPFASNEVLARNILNMKE